MKNCEAYRYSQTRHESAFTLIEIIIVIAIIAGVYSIALPNFSLRTANEVANQLGALTRDIRSAWDYSVLNNKPYRLVFAVPSGKYWLETTDNPHFKMGDGNAEKDLSADEEKERAAAFDQEFSKYEDMAKDVVKDANGENEIKPTSPVLAAKDRLKGTTWYRIETAEWSGRSLGDQLIIKDMRAEHHAQAITGEDSDSENKVVTGMIYIFPNGYIEKAYLHIYFKGVEEGNNDPALAPYTVYTNPYMGTASIAGGVLELDVTGAWEIGNDS